MNALTRLTTMKTKTVMPKNLIRPTFKAVCLLGCVLSLSSCISLPLISYEAPKKQTTHNSTQFHFTPTTITPPTHTQKIADITTEKTHKEDLSRTFYPIIWQEMQHKFHLSIDHLGKYDTHIDHLKQRPNYLKTVSQRAKPYLHYILTQVQMRDMPYEMALLPIIESGFQPTAHSHKEANGLWQFIPSTGRIYGLEQSWWYDGRQDVIQSTQAALDYLQKLYKMNNNDWLLALASYNAGPGTIRKAIRKYNKAQVKSGQPANNTPSFWDISPYLPKETQKYVPSLLAVSHVINHNDSFNVDLEPIDNRPFFEAVPLPKQIHLQKARQLAQVSKTTFNQLNSGYLAKITPPNGAYQILLPIENAKEFREHITSTPELFEIQWQKHTIKRGESLGLIAQKYKTSQKEIKKLNNMKNHHIRAGKTLLIPIPNNALEPQATSTQLARSTPSKPTRHKTTVTLKKGQSLWSIAQTYNVTTKALARWNNIPQSKTLQPGMKLIVWKTNKKTNTFSRYKIKSGDNLWKIAKKNRISTRLLAKYNNLSTKAYLKPGQVLKIPI